ncbi:unnamed protein product [Fusarium graminearum]|uniref:Chromosome 2, complete genome n=1 Tax=Gibberella zeae (strain ATCC MYA-4620 / CBS 123657 / FGSC 9075 / NRRL 31084 / PH-1) TaxID=229533 RepID=A0A098DCM3_GIBZE|nr:unnamed protein product [Fusarium graminearum]
MPLEEDDLKKLTKAAAPLFIFAATTCRFIDDSNLGQPKELLESVFNHMGNHQASKLALTYSPVLKRQTTGKSKRARGDIIKNFHLVVGTIVILASPLLQRALALLLRI